MALYLRNHFEFSSNNFSARENIQEDIWSRIFYEPSEFFHDLPEYFSEGSFDLEGNASREDRFFTEGDIGRECDRERWNPRGLEGWYYNSPFADVTVEVDDVDQYLYDRYLKKIQYILPKLKDEIQSGRYTSQLGNADLWNTLGSRMDCLRCFLPNSILEIVRSNVNRVLASRSRPLISVQELLGVIVLHILAASYGESPSTICRPDNSDCFLQIGISANRYKEIWSAFSCTTRPRQGAEHSNQTWHFKSRRGNDFVLDLEETSSSVNRHLVHAPGSSAFALDDDHLRLSSRAVEEKTDLRSVNNPNKAFGPVCKALCSAMNPFIIACHYSRPKESLLDIWIRLVQLLQGKPTKGSLNYMANVIFAADRGYNCGETIKFLTEDLGATLIGTHKRSLDYPFVFGEGPIRKRHKGMVVSEKGCRAVYSASHKMFQRGTVEASVYRESYSGRIAATFHNNPRLLVHRSIPLFPAAGFVEYMTTILSVSCRLCMMSDTNG